MTFSSILKPGKIIFQITALFCLVLFALSCSAEQTIAQPHCDLTKNHAESESINCGTIEVPENHDDAQSKKIQIAYLVLKAKDASSQAYPMIYFSGGPGGRMLSANSIKGWMQHPVRAKRDIIIFDQRGIGYSSAIPNMHKDLFDVMARDATESEEQKWTTEVIKDYKQKCKSQNINLEYYNTFQNAKDVGRLMNHLGYEKYNLYGSSYGTRLARVIQDMFPEKLHTVIHNSPAPLTGDFLINRLDSYGLALSRIFNYCKNNTGCNQQYPNLEADYHEAIAQLKKEPLEIDLDGQPFFVNAQDGVYLIRRKLYGNDSRTAIPEMIKAFLEKDKSIIKNVVDFERRFGGGINSSMLLAVERYEQYMPQFTTNEVEAYYDNLPLLNVRLGYFDAVYEAGRDWHNAVLTESKKQFQPSSIPTLITVNQYDPVTPPENGHLFKKQLSNAHLFILDEGGHGGGNTACRHKVMIAFMDDPNQTLDSSCFNLYEE